MQAYDPRLGASATSEIHVDYTTGRVERRAFLDRAAVRQVVVKMAQADNLIDVYAETA